MADSEADETLLMLVLERVWQHTRQRHASTCASALVRKRIRADEGVCACVWCVARTGPRGPCRPARAT